VLDSLVKEADIAPIGSQLMNLPFPFASIGIMHPIFHPSDDLREAVGVMRENMSQIELYLQTYCSESRTYWCRQELASFKNEFEEVDGLVVENDHERIAKLEKMALLMNERYKRLADRWIGKD